jgi:hypothetical protein
MSQVMVNIVRIQKHQRNSARAFSDVLRQWPTMKEKAKAYYLQKARENPKLLMMVLCWIWSGRNELVRK